jgi:hypothetical protein
MATRLQNTINILVPTGALGAGVRESDLIAGLAAGAHAIACDAGSTDSGPAYLATGRSKYSRDAVKTDLTSLMQAQARSGLTCDIALEIAREHSLSPRIALLYSEQTPALMSEMAASGKVTALAPMTGNGADLFEQCAHVVALMGPEPYMAALEAGADIVLGGRTTDTAVLAALPLLRGAGAGPAWHAGKIAECGGLCSVRQRDGGVMIRIGLDAFEVEPLSASNACTPASVSAHMLYENSDPFLLLEPGGILDVSQAKYSAVNERVVHVSGSRFLHQPYTMKLEGASSGAFQTIMLVGIQDRAVLAELERFLAQMHHHLLKRVNDTMGPRAGPFDISLRPYGWNAVSGLPMPANSAVPVEVGLLFVATAASQDIATQIAKTCNPMFFHMPLNLDTPLPSYAFPFSPAEIERGAVYEFMLNHAVHVEQPLALVRTVFIQAGSVVHA